MKWEDSPARNKIIFDLMLSNLNVKKRTFKKLKVILNDDDVSLNSINFDSEMSSSSQSDNTILPKSKAELFAHYVTQF